ATALACNAATMGNPLRFPFTVVSSADTVGFGLRRIHPTDAFVHFGLPQAFQGFGWFLAWSLAFFAGGPLLWWLAARQLHRRRGSTAERILLLGVAVFL